MVTSGKSSNFATSKDKRDDNLRVTTKVIIKVMRNLMFTARLDDPHNKSTWSELCTNNLNEVKKFWFCMRSLGYSHGRITVRDTDNNREVVIHLMDVEKFFDTVEIMGLGK